MIPISILNVSYRLSINLFDKNKELNEVFGEKFVKTLVAMRKVEYLAYMEVVSPWEREYLLLNV